jgi:HAD domain in Swiss Army Knife RNA repair proteins
MAPKEHPDPILFVDVDGVLSLFGFPHDREPPGRFHMVDGMTHCLGHGTGRRLQALSEHYELVWATGWEERANEHLPYLLELPFRDLPTLTFDGRAEFGSAHWKIAAIDSYAGDRPAAWIDDFLDEECWSWARRRTAPTLLVQTESAVGLGDEHVQQLLDWAREVVAEAEPG